MSSPLLRDEELDNIANAVDETQYETSSEYFKAILKEAIKAEAKHLVEWLNVRSFSLQPTGEGAVWVIVCDKEKLFKEVGLDA